MTDNPCRIGQLASNGKLGFVGGLAAGWWLIRASASAKTHSEQSAKCPAGERLNGSAAVNAEMVPSELHLNHATGSGRAGAAAREP
ncbi:hypothetical protein GCM10017643_32500 [Ancylobacter dichloromethanicus]|uniref:Uncharacterized protein n=1 Tax=Ancylobacter dichloromethanicus TaxID=518825 RepID=A0A9W6MZV5_9HYPH|nr:hypothetical protein GCM10017643_32500 [Ancylobacter dichloromethanicus]